MPVHPPIVRRFVPPTEEEMAATRAEAERIREEHSERRRRDAPARRAAVLAGPALGDVDAAVECPCSCHPRPADPDLHGGGVECQCQRTPEELANERRTWSERWSEVMSELDDPDGDDDLALAAEALDVTVQVAVSACPFVLVGTCDGRGFYLRERHGAYRVTIAADDDPASDPWRAEPTDTTIDVAAGDYAELVADGRFSAAAALRVAVDAVRTALARNACHHASADESIGAHCPTCGVRLNDAADWRWTAP